MGKSCRTHSVVSCRILKPSNFICSVYYMATSKYTVRGKYCSPLASSSEAAGANGGSCYTKQQLINIAHAYNNKYNDKINIYGTKDDIWNQLEQRMRSCSNEWCWMKRLHLEDTFIQQYGASPFRPIRPAGKKAWLGTYDIRDVLKQYEQVYPDFISLGPVPIDFCQLAFNEVCRLNLKQILSKGKRRIGIVYNTDKSNKPGKHWVSMFIDLTGNPEHWEINYFDSFGKAKIAPEIMELIEHLKSQNPHFIVRMNCSDKACTSAMNHQKKNTECGVYSINFIVERLRGKSWDDLVINNLYNDENMLARRSIFFRPTKGDTHPW